MNQNIFLSKTALAVLLILIVAALAVFISLKFFGNSSNQIISETPTASLPPSAVPTNQENPTPSFVSPSLSPGSLISGKLTVPLDRWQERVTKKPFGIFVSPTNSPISPEKFTGYHTGVDFETFSAEQDKDVAVSAVCAGPLLVKKFATGYGGVAVQSCKLDNQDVTIIYGHLKLASIQANVGQQLSAGEQIGILGKSFSIETDGERKHLHLSVHKGKEINILGYVQKQADLIDWLDATKFF